MVYANLEENDKKNADTFLKMLKDNELWNKTEFFVKYVMRFVSQQVNIIIYHLKKQRGLKTFYISTINTDNGPVIFSFYLKFKALCKSK